ncbi:MAG: kinase, partial [Gammaproteobacteria bacterium]
MNKPTNYSQLIKQFIDRESLPASYSMDAERWFVPLAELCVELLDSIPELPLCIGINGCQGSGKSTLSALLQILLRAAGRSVVLLSIDDFYLAGERRRQLAQDIHPLLQTRGVPGTHDIAQALNCMQQLQQLQPGQKLALPRFDKATDEPLSADQWPQVTGPVELIIFEGWFVGSSPQIAAELVNPVNELEA